MNADTRRRALLVAMVAAGAVTFAVVAQRHDPLSSWLFFRYLRAGLLAALFGLSCLVAGHAILLRVLRRSLPFEEHFAIAFALGVLAFFLTSFGLGLVGLYGTASFLLCPSLLLWLGGRRAITTWLRVRRHVARLDLRLRLTPLQLAILLFGCIGIALVWFPILTPQNASYDARWYHLPIAQHYLAEGKIGPFTEGWIPGALPQLASLLYGWALSAPSSLFERIEAAAHIELVIFLATLVGIPALVRRATGKRSALSWSALFLFPGIFCYDSGLVLGADHVAALWAAPILLLSLRYWHSPSSGIAVLLGAVTAGALSTKYTALSLAVVPLLVVATRTVVGSGRRMTWRTAVLALAVVLLCWAPHWLKNLVYYSDPFYPLLRNYLPSQLWAPAAEAPYQAWFSLWRPELGWAGLLEMVEALFSFSFVHHDFPQYHGALPVFGSLFTLCTPLLLLLRDRRRLPWLFGAAYLGLMAWFWIHQGDRYLQALVPWMAAGTAGVLALLWREGRGVRAAMAGLVGLQLIWGASVPFIPAHRAAGTAIQKAVIDLLGRPFRTEDPLATYPAWEAIGRALPQGAKVLVHEEQIHFGLSAATALDYPGYQGALYWGEPGATTPADVFRLLRAHGITHLVWAANLDHASDTVAGGLVFFDFALHHGTPLGTFGGFSLVALPESVPAATPPGEVAYYPCGSAPPFAPGLYGLAALARAPDDRRPIAAPARDVSMEQAFERAEYLVFDASCHGPLPAPVRDRFSLLAARGRAMMLKRKPQP